MNDTDSKKTRFIDETSSPEMFILRGGKLVAISGPDQGKEMVVDCTETTIGSAKNNTFVLSDQTVSRNHAMLLEATGGYLVGFVLAAALVGLMVERTDRGAPALVPVMMVGVLVIYAVGAAWLAAVMGLSAGEAVALGVAPFLLLDLLKSVLAAGTARVVTTRA